MAKSHVHEGVAFGLAAVAIGLLTTLSGTLIELTSGFFADLRHGICVERLPGDARVLWRVALEGGWRPYDRLRCCGGSLLVDHTSQVCRSPNIVRSSVRKRIAHRLSWLSFGQMVDIGEEFPLRAVGFLARSVAASQRDLQAGGAEPNPQRDIGTIFGAGGIPLGSNRSRITSLLHRARVAQVDDIVGVDAQRVRAHISGGFAPDPKERWADERPELMPTSFAEAEAQTQSESTDTVLPIREWIPWGQVLRGALPSFVWQRGPVSLGSSTPILGSRLAIGISVFGSALLAGLAALVTRECPAARGSGIPEVKAVVAGFAVSKSFSAWTLAGKILALSLCVGAGLAVGKEGPMIHIGACWGSLLALPLGRLLSQLRPSVGSHGPLDTELICVGGAAGVAAAFGAPLAGVLFAVEELGTTRVEGLKHSTMLFAFGSAVVAALALRWLDLSQTHRLALFEVDYRQAWAPWEALPFTLLGLLGGALGSLFVLANEAVTKLRVRARQQGRVCCWVPTFLEGVVRRWFLPQGGPAERGPAIYDSRVLEVVAIAVLTAASNSPCGLTRMLQNDAIMALFGRCAEQGDPLGICFGEQEGLTAAAISVVFLLVGSALLRLLQTVITFGALTPAGLFVPSLFIGGCMGRAVGMVLRLSGLPGTTGTLIEPGMYAMVGAGAVLAGVSRLTVSLVVVLFELTGGLTYVVPFMMAVLIAKWSGDRFTLGRSIYDVHADLNGFAKVEQLPDGRVLNASLYDLYEHGPNASLAATTACTPPALWLSQDGSVPSGCARACDLEAHCRVAVSAGGFAVLSSRSAGSSQGVEVVGWMRTSRLLALLSETPEVNSFERHPQRLCRVQRQAGFTASGCSLEDVSSALDESGLVHVRHDCPLLTAVCIFRRSPTVQALAITEPATGLACWCSWRQNNSSSVWTITRERFLRFLEQGHVAASTVPWRSSEGLKFELMADRLHGRTGLVRW